MVWEVLVKGLLKERPEYENMQISSDAGEQKMLLRSLMNMRTDIPAFYSKWFLNRIKEGYVLVRNPYNEKQVTRYRLTQPVCMLTA